MVSVKAIFFNYVLAYHIYFNKRRPRLTAALDQPLPLNKCRIWGKNVNKRRPRISAAPPDALTADIFALVILKFFGVFSPREFLS